MGYSDDLRTITAMSLEEEFMCSPELKEDVPVWSQETETLCSLALQLIDQGLFVAAQSAYRYALRIAASEYAEIEINKMNLRRAA